MSSKVIKPTLARPVKLACTSWYACPPKLGWDGAVKSSVSTNLAADYLPF